MDDIEQLANLLGEYIMKKFVVPYLKKHGFVQSYRAQVVSVDAGAKTMTVQRPFDSAVTVPYSDGAAALSPGDQCTVFVLGESSNASVVSDGKLNL